MPPLPLLLLLLKLLKQLLLARLNDPLTSLQAAITAISQQFSPQQPAL
jgi:hypothetical protein